MNRSFLWAAPLLLGLPATLVAQTMLFPNRFYRVLSP
jgi:hypothetical protein